MQINVKEFNFFKNKKVSIENINKDKNINNQFIKI